MRRVVYPAILGAIIGLVFAVVRALPFFFAIHFPKVFRKSCEVINAPALWAARAWSDGAGLPSGGELGRQLFVPSVAIMAQWVLVVVFIGLCLGWKRGRSSGKKG
jgi:hypothetical protein